MPSKLLPGFDKPYAAFLFDMDGTILNSTAAAERVWAEWSRRQGLDVEAFMPTMHGSRAVDTIARLKLPGIDPEREAQMITDAEILDVEGVVALPGAAAFLKSLPLDRWAIVTSSPAALAGRRLAAAGLPVPRFMVAADEVTRGKPDPQCYLLGAQKLGVDAGQCLVFEDVPAGILAGEAAGCDVMVVTTTHKHPMQTDHPTIAGYDDIIANNAEDGRVVLSRAG